MNEDFIANIVKDLINMGVLDYKTDINVNDAEIEYRIDIPDNFSDVLSKEIGKDMSEAVVATAVLLFAPDTPRYKHMENIDKLDGGFLELYPDSITLHSSALVTSKHNEEISALFDCLFVNILSNITEKDLEDTKKYLIDSWDDLEDVNENLSGLTLRDIALTHKALLLCKSKLTIIANPMADRKKTLHRVVRDYSSRLFKYRTESRLATRDIKGKEKI